VGRFTLLARTDSSDQTAIACCVHVGSRSTLYLVVFRASSHVQMIPSERDLLYEREPGESALS
jgi:hypothetical protein